MNEKSPLPPSISHIDLPGGKTKLYNIHRIWGINGHFGKTDYDSSAKTNSDTDDWLHWNGNLDNPIYSETNGEADDKDDTNISDVGFIPLMRQNSQRYILPLTSWALFGQFTG
jgi:hypothetical protein